MFTYVIATSDSLAVKIGRSIDPSRRIADLQTAHHEKLKLISYVEGDYEAVIHDKCRAFRLSGEWFRYAADVRSILASFKFTKLPRVTCQASNKSLPVGADYVYEAQQCADGEVIEADCLYDVCCEIDAAIFDHHMQYWVDMEIDDWYVPECTYEDSSAYVRETYYEEYGECPLISDIDQDIYEAKCLVGFNRKDRDGHTAISVFFIDPATNGFRRRIFNLCVEACIWADALDDIYIRCFFFNASTATYEVIAEG